jgi:four helix bundle protein
MTIIRSYRDLDVWQVSMSLTERAYAETRSSPKEELFGMTGQIRRSAASIPANIAEGYGRERTASFIQFLRVAQGSAKELETHLLLSERVGLLASAPAQALLSDCERVSKMLRNLIRSLEAKTSRGTT